MTNPMDSTGSGRFGIIVDFAGSELFDRTFREGMALVEETAGYLDGPGRLDSKMLSRASALNYASESMRLTTRLMQVASWLLVQRAVREGEMGPDAACEDRYRVTADDVCLGAGEHEGLPERLVDLLERSEKLYDRVWRLDRRMYVELMDEPEHHPVLSQHDRIRGAFGA
jgi:regulator of CtrA degradation